MIKGFGRQMEEYQEDVDTTVRVSGGSNYFGLACCIMQKLNQFGKVDLTCLGGPPAWQKDLAVSVVLRNNPKDSIKVELKYVVIDTLKAGLTRLEKIGDLLSIDDFIERTNPNAEKPESIH